VHACGLLRALDTRLLVLNSTLLQMYAGAASGAAATPGRAPKPKTPRCEDGGGAGSGSLSPNQRVRKLRRSGPAFGASPGAAAALFSCTAWPCIPSPCVGSTAHCGRAYRARRGRATFAQPRTKVARPGRMRGVRVLEALLCLAVQTGYASQHGIPAKSLAGCAWLSGT